MTSFRELLRGVAVAAALTLAFGPARTQAWPPQVAPVKKSPAGLRTPAPAPPRASGGIVEAPAHRGTGYFVVAGVITGVAVVQQLSAYLLLQHTCGVARAKIDTLETFDGESTPITDRAQLAAGAAVFGLACFGSAGPALTLRMHTPLYLGAAVGLASAGGLARGRSDAFRDALIRRRDRSRPGRLPEVLGGVLLGTGVALWIGTRVALLDNKPGCAALNCIVAYDLLTLQSSALMTMTGAALLSQGIAYRRHLRRYIRIRELGATPFASRGSYGLAISGSF